MRKPFRSIILLVVTVTLITVGLTGCKGRGGDSGGDSGSFTVKNKSTWEEK